MLSANLVSGGALATVTGFGELASLWWVVSLDDDLLGRVAVVVNDVTLELFVGSHDGL